MKYICIVIGVLCVALSTSSPTTFQWTHDSPVWQRSSGNVGNPVCVDIPVNMSLCHGIGYTKMRLPNLLQHDSLQEVSQQSVSWVPLFQVGCHPDTQLFLCSLFTPVCLDHPIPPCRSLCQSVQVNCERTMSKYGYPWPQIVRCDQFPIDNDMCIQAQHSQKSAGQVLTNTKDGQQQGEDGEKRQRTKPKKHRNKHNKQLRHDSSKPQLETLPTPSLSQQSRNEAQVEKQPPLIYNSNERPKVNRGTNGKDKGESNDDKRHLYNLILSKYCSTRWSIKARAVQETTERGPIVLKVKNYRVIHGSFPEDMKQMEVTVPTNQTDRLREGADTTPLTRRRYFIMGRNVPGRINEAVFVIVWPHKMGQFRKALKMIKSGDMNCSGDDDTTTPAESISPKPSQKVKGQGGGKRERAEKRWQREETVSMRG